MTTIFSTFRCKTAYSMAAPTPEYFFWSKVEINQVLYSPYSETKISEKKERRYG